MDKIVIIGCGAAGITAAENIRKNNRDSKIIMISDEPYLPYYRLKIGKYLCSEFSVQSVYIHKEQWYAENNIDILLGKTAVKIDTAKNMVYLEDGSSHEYNSLILANGSRCFIPPIAGAEKQGVFTIRTIDDILSIQDYENKTQSRNITVIGGGLLGIEAAYAYKENEGSYNVNIIETAERLLPRQLDQEGSAYLEEHLKNKGINIYKSAKISCIAGGESSDHIELNDGTKILSDIVIISAGVRPNLAIAQASGIAVDRGIIVDKNMKTNIANVYAAGDCAQFGNMIWGIWPVSVEQGKIAGLNAAGVDQEYNEITPSNLLQIAGMNVFSAGDITNPSIGKKYENGIYSKLFIDDGVIKGVILMGDTKKGFAVKKAIEEKRILSKEIVESKNIFDSI